MVQNYLSTARERYDRERERGGNGAPDDESHKRTVAPPPEEEVRCINSGCDGLAGAATSYLCSTCFERQRQDELNMRNSCSSTVESVDSAWHSDVGSAGIPRVDSGPCLPRQIQSPKYAGGSRGGSAAVVINVAPSVNTGSRVLEAESLGGSSGGGSAKQRTMFHMDVNGSSLLNTTTPAGGSLHDSSLCSARSGAIIHMEVNDATASTATVAPGKRSLASSSSSTPNGTITGFPYGESSIRIPVTQHGYESGRLPIGSSPLSSYTGTKYVQSVIRPYSPETFRRKTRFGAGRI